MAVMLAPPARKTLRSLSRAIIRRHWKLPEAKRGQDGTLVCCGDPLALSYGSSDLGHDAPGHGAERAAVAVEKRLDHVVVELERGRAFEKTVMLQEGVHRAVERHGDRMWTRIDAEEQPQFRSNADDHLGPRWPYEFILNPDDVEDVEKRQWL